MATTVRQDLDAVNVRLQITVPATEFKAKVASEMNRVVRNVRIKGFREGKAPMSMVKNLYGEGVLIDTLNKMVEAELNAYLNANPMNILGQPILATEQPKFALSFEPKTDAVVNFDLGLVPQFDLKGLDSATVVDQYEVAIPDAEIDEQIKQVGSRMGERQQVESGIEDNDMLMFEVDQINGEINNEFKVLSQDLTDSARAAVQNLAVGGTFAFNPYNFEKNTNEKHVNTYFLGLPEGATPEDDAQYEFRLANIERTSTLEWGQEYWDKYFGKDVVTDEAQARFMFKDSLAQQHKGNVDALFFREAQDVLMAQNPVELPDAFLKRWLVQSDEKNTPEMVEREYSAFAGNLKWSIIRDKIAKQAAIGQLNYGDIEVAYRERIKGYMGGMSNADLENMLVERFLSDEKQVNSFAEELMSDRIFGAIRENVSLNIKTVSAEEFRAVIVAINEQVKAEQAALAQGEMVTEEI